MGTKQIYPLDATEQIMCDQISSGVITMSTAVFELNSPVCPEALQFAAEQLLKRHPYLATRLRWDGLNYYLEENDLPVVIREARLDAPLCFGDSSNNYYQWMLTYSGNEIYIDKSHFIMDGSAAHFWTAELLEHYTRYLQGDHSELPPLSPEELADECALPTDIAGGGANEKPFYVPKDVRPTPFKEGVFKKEPVTECVMVSLPLEEIRQRAKKAEVSPFAVIAPILFKACLPLLAEEENAEKVVCAMMPVSGRPMFNTNTFHNFAAVKVLNYYHTRMKDMPYEKVATIFRSRLDLLTQKEDIALVYGQRKKLWPLLNDPEKRKLVSGAMNNTLQNPNQITYTHMSKARLSEAARAQIKRCYLVVSSELPNIICVGITENDSVNLSFPDNFSSSEFFDSLFACIRELGLSFTSERIYYPQARAVHFEEEAVAVSGDGAAKE
ncbi:MAG: hypothetical protein Q4B50_02590 [Bacillota bacterium]|nr:hypothetical protein [Bacillota bacterium]